MSKQDQEEKAHNEILNYFMEYFETIPIQQAGFYKVHTKSINKEQILALAKLDTEKTDIKRSGNGITIIIIR